MGGGADIPEAPDYDELTDFMKEFATYASGKSKEMQAWAERAYTENKGVSDIIIDKALGAMDRAEDDEKWARDRYRNIFSPLEEQLAAEAESYASPERLEAEAGKAEADVAAQFEQARQTATQRLEGYGVDPSQTRQGAMDLGTRVAEAASQASAGNQARWHAEDVGRQLRSEAINVGKGYPGQVATSMGLSGTAGNQGVNTGLATTASGAQTKGTGQTWGALGSQNVTGWGNLLNQNFNQELASAQAEDQQSSGWGELIGTLGGAFLGGPGGAKLGSAVGGWFAEGGVIPEEDGQYLDPAMSPSGGQVTDDIPAQIEGGQPAQLNAGEFVIPEDVVSWVGEKGMQQFILKARKEMTGANGERPAQPTEGPPPPSYQGGGIPEPMGTA